MPRLVLRWVFVGWWAVPLLAIGAILAAVLDAGGYWDGKKWVTDPDLDAAFLWCCEQIGTFFQQNTEGQATAKPLPAPVCSPRSNHQKTPE